MHHWHVYHVITDWPTNYYRIINNLKFVVVVKLVTLKGAHTLSPTVNLLPLFIHLYYLHYAYPPTKPA